MKLRAPGPKAVTLTPVHPSAAVRAWYEAQLLKLINAMGAEVLRELPRAYNKHIAGKASDGALYRLMQALRKKWHKQFEDEAKSLAVEFVERSRKHHDLVFKASLAKALGVNVAMDSALPSMPKVKLQLSARMKKTLKAKVHENAGLITNMPEDCFHKIEQHIARSAGRGRELTKLTDFIQERMDITRRRASLIARDQNNKATALIHATRQKDLGITKAKWIHTGASLHPREDHAAFAAGGSPYGDGGPFYDPEVGVDFDDDFGEVLPGEAVNCGCLSASVIPGYDDDETDEDSE